MRAQTRTGLVLVVLAALGASCKVKGERKPYAQVGANAQALREAFNADVGKVRLIVLVAPT
jgi:hypothetical protein